MVSTFKIQQAFYQPLPGSGLVVIQSWNVVLDIYFFKKKKLKEPEFGLVQVTLDLAGLFKFIWVYC
jgi:hypothetical protein